MSLENRNRKKHISIWEYFNQTLGKYIPAENKIRKIKNYKDLLLKTKQVFSGQNSENFSEEYGR